jgi:hypothetical protein
MCERERERARERERERESERERERRKNEIKTLNGDRRKNRLEIDSDKNKGFRKDTGKAKIER